MSDALAASNVTSRNGNSQTATYSGHPRCAGLHFAVNCSARERKPRLADPQQGESDGERAETAENVALETTMRHSALLRLLP